MKSKPIVAFILGVVVGAALLLGFEHAPKLGNLFRSQAEVMQASVPGKWNGKVEVSGTNVPFSLTVKSDGKVLSGVLTAPQVGNIPCSAVAIDPLGNISFSVHVDDKEADFTGKLAPDTNSMAGNMTSSMGGGMWTLAKSKS